MRKEEKDAQVLEDLGQIRLEIGECVGSSQPHVQLRLNRALDAVERIARTLEHGVGPGEAPPVQRPGVLPDGLNRDDQTRQDRFATTEQVRGQRRPGDTTPKHRVADRDVKVAGEGSPDAQAATAKAEATKSVAGEEDRPKAQAGKK